jgi:hypothetical protein
MSGLSWLMLQQEIGSVLLLLLLNEVRVVNRGRGNTNFCQYLSVSTLQPCLIHVVSALFFLGTVATLPLSMYFSVRSN